MKDEIRVGIGRIAILHDSTDEDSNMARRIREDIEPLIAKFSADVDCVATRCNDCYELYSALSQLESEIHDTGPPLPILLFHGDANSGLQVGSTKAPWEICSKYLSAINGKAGNTTIVIAAACYGLTLIHKPNIFKPAPFKILWAPDKEISNGTIENKLREFTKHLFVDDDIDAAAQSMKPSFVQFVPETILRHSLRELLSGLKGRRGDKRREKMIANVLGLAPIELDRSLVRSNIKHRITKFDDKLLHVILGTYFCGRPESFNANDLK